MSFHRRKRRTARRGLSLLEVMLAIAILGSSMAVIGELVRMGARSAARARDLSTAQILCQSKLDEIAVGIEPPASSSGIFPLSPDWMYTVLAGPAQQEGLLFVQVTVSKIDEGDAYNPTTFDLVRWMVDPSLEAMLEEEAALSNDSTEDGASTEDADNAMP